MPFLFSPTCVLENPGRPWAIYERSVREKWVKQTDANTYKSSIHSLHLDQEMYKGFSVEKDYQSPGPIFLMVPTPRQLCWNQTRAFISERSNFSASCEKKKKKKLKRKKKGKKRRQNWVADAVGKTNEKKCRYWQVLPVPKMVEGLLKG